jgi:hypothetical protein
VGSVLYESEVPAQVGSCCCDMHAEGATGMQAVVEAAGIGLEVNGNLPVGKPVDPCQWPPGLPPPLSQVLTY